MSDAAVTTLSEQECWDLLAGEEFGRLATSAAGSVAITPVNYCVRDQKIYFRSAEGSKLVSLVVASSVAFEIDQVRGRDAWSVIGQGEARIVDSMSEQDELSASLHLHPWVDTVKEIFVEVTLDEVSGRRFRLAR
ncbi:pyridoxamine 5'-phosphate oxidase family protein [Arsenicicoccus piscis]|uniref:Pyridoxamine 5'-phosphate oxidase n=1 Tax=Arsenicicoccus piscis TaxID=673954 RepID=A0ABQ6HMT9_9MICO|nr:pyridoxamine 5'-phosphate oxidase family protein [Arsenicicoccus piscis]MCH8629261.1 pyridoxamine 5'-phosphate oxidase family protein [Arsenicicoccus piscis]GMA19781.1 pyridoxamine 5'-phosphate oxidase [Arsenicicoccus piscis]